MKKNLTLVFLSVSSVSVGVCERKCHLVIRVGLAHEVQQCKPGQGLID